VVMPGLHGGPRLTATVSLCQFLGCCLLVISAILALRILVLIFRPTAPREAIAITCRGRQWT
jgi:ubiquinone biosynthesis protein